jgi:sulfur relay (sulfurtransferase) DsrF/TusC family protein
MGKGRKHVVLAMHSGTYGRTDDVSGALILANSMLTADMEVTVLLKGDGVYTAISDQDPKKVGYEQHLLLLGSTFEMGGQILVLSEALKERGLTNDDLIDDVRTITEKDLPGLMARADHWLPF